MEKLRAAWVWISEPSRRFIPLFLGILWILSTVTGKLMPQTSLTWFLKATAWLDYQLVDLFFDNVTQRGTALTHDGFSVQVIVECTGLFEAVILVSAVLAYKATWRERAIGILLGVSTLYLINVMIICINEHPSIRSSVQNCLLTEKFPFYSNQWRSISSSSQRQTTRHSVSCRTTPRTT